MQEHIDLTIIPIQGSNEYLVQATSPAGNAASRFLPPPHEHLRSPSIEEKIIAGSRLFQALFHGPTGTLYRSNPLPITLHISPSLAGLPWGWLYDPRQKAFLSNMLTVQVLDNPATPHETNQMPSIHTEQTLVQPAVTPSVSAPQPTAMMPQIQRPQPAPPTPAPAIAAPRRSTSSGVKILFIILLIAALIAIAGGILLAYTGVLNRGSTPPPPPAITTPTTAIPAVVPTETPRPTIAATHTPLPAAVATQTPIPAATPTHPPSPTLAAAATPTAATTPSPATTPTAKPAVPGASGTEAHPTGTPTPPRDSAPR